MKAKREEAKHEKQNDLAVVQIDLANLPLDRMVAILLLILPGCSTAGESSVLQYDPQKEETAAGSPTIGTGNFAFDDIYDSDDFAFDWQSGSYETIQLNGDTMEAGGSKVAVINSIATITSSGVYEILLP